MTLIHLYNSMTRRKEALRPKSDVVGLYVCGPTVYDRAHIGNARPAVVFDTLFRLLRHQYGKDAVRYVRNFTDVDDKINARAQEIAQKDTTRPLTAIIRDLTNGTIADYHEDMDALGVLRPTLEPRATDHIADMTAFIADLISKGHAYEAEGHVLFEVATDPDYGCLSRRSLEDMQAGARVEVAPYKRSAMDFVLWKPSTPDQPGWDSPWGRGRPGWHIECSAMADKLLGRDFDIHGGGIDLQFPHHENELAQSRCAHPGHGFAAIWMHNGFLQVEGEKMSKSLGNFFTVKDLRDKGIPGEVIRFVLLSAQYRQPIDWTERAVEEALNILRRWRNAVEQVEASAPSQTLLNALADDLNTPRAITELHALAKSDPPALKASAGLLGLLGDELGAWSRAGMVDLSRQLAQLTELRAAAMENKDFSAVDACKAALLAAGVEVRMSKSGIELKAGPKFNATKAAEVLR